MCAGLAKLRVSSAVNPNSSVAQLIGQGYNILALVEVFIIKACEVIVPIILDLRRFNFVQ